MLYEGFKTKVVAMCPTINRIVRHQDWCKARVYIISISILPGNILDCEENRHMHQKRDHVHIHRINRITRLCIWHISLLDTATETYKVKLRNWSETLQKLDFMLKRQTQNNAKQLSNGRPIQTRRTRHIRGNIVHTRGSQIDKRWKHRG